MKSLSLLLAVSLLVASCRRDIRQTPPPAPHYEALVSDSLLYHFLNTTLLEGNSTYKSGAVLLDHATIIVNGDSSFVAQLDTLRLSAADRDFIRRQYRNSHYFTWDGKRVKGKTVVAANTIADDREAHRTYRRRLMERYHGLTSVRGPFFTKKGDVAVVECDLCCGFLCGEGATFIYRKDANGNWRLYLEINRWVS